MVNVSMPASCSLAAMQRPDMPAPMIATFSERFCDTVTPSMLAREWPNGTPSAAADIDGFDIFAI